MDTVHSGTNGTTGFSTDPDHASSRCQRYCKKYIATDGALYTTMPWYRWDFWTWTWMRTRSLCVLCIAIGGAMWLCNRKSKSA